MEGARDVVTVAAIGKLRHAPMSSANFFRCAPHQRGSRAATIPARISVPMNKGNHWVPRLMTRLQHLCRKKIVAAWPAT